MHLPRRELRFERRGRIYVADMRDWIQDRRTYATVKQNEELYNKKEVIKAQTAQEFIHNAAYPSEKEAAHLVMDGNITDIPVSAADIYRAYDIYGVPVAAIRGKATRHKVSRQDVDDTLKEQKTDQIMYTDVMKVRNQPYLISLVEPLELVLTTPTENDSAENLGRASGLRGTAGTTPSEKLQARESAHRSAEGTRGTSRSVPRGGDRYLQRRRPPRQN